RYDAFLSHTWMTHGRWKFLSLLLHFGWPTLLVAWALGATVAFILSLVGLLPLFASWEARAIDFDEHIPLGCWVMLSGGLATWVGAALFPYLRCGPSHICFLDFLCIHQTDVSKMQQGIRSIGHYLAASAELHVLWSNPYLSRLWCVFELAAYRKL
ncbi:unnamed protein product, partial [Symbiodinium pilosum]